MKKVRAAFLILCSCFFLFSFCGPASAAEPCEVEVHLQQNAMEKTETIQGLSGDIPFLLLRDFSSLTGKYIHWFADSGAIGWTTGNRAFFTHPRSEFIYTVDCTPVFAEEPKQEIKSFVPSDVVETPVPEDPAAYGEDVAENVEIEEEAEPQQPSAVEERDEHVEEEQAATIWETQVPPEPVIIGWQYTVKKEKLPTPLTVEKDQTYIHSSFLSYLGYNGVWSEPEAQYSIVQTSDQAVTVNPPLEAAYSEIKATLVKDLPTEPTALGRYKTSFNAKEKNRTINLKLAAAAINGQVIQPGKTFSFNKTVGPRTKERGYLKATIFVGGKKEQGLGGGICQVSSTLYNAVLNSKLKVVERHTHSLPVTYVPTGKDATVSYGYLDFRFQNNRKYPVKIQAVVNKNTLDIAFVSVDR